MTSLEILILREPRYSHPVDPVVFGPEYCHNQSYWDASSRGEEPESYPA